MGETNVLFSIGPLEVTGAVVTMWVIVAVLALVSWLATRRLRDVPGPLQNAAEMAVEKLQGFYGGIMGPANARRYFPMMATFFIFIVVSNYIGLLPGAGQVFTVPTATLSVTAGLAIIAFCMTHTVGIPAPRSGRLSQELHQALPAHAAAQPHRADRAPVFTRAATVRQPLR